MSSHFTAKMQRHSLLHVNGRQGEENAAEEHAERDADRHHDENSCRRDKQNKSKTRFFLHETSRHHQSLRFCLSLMADRSQSLRLEFTNFFVQTN